MLPQILFVLFWLVDSSLNASEQQKFTFQNFTGEAVTLKIPAITTSFTRSATHKMKTYATFTLAAHKDAQEITFVSSSSTVASERIRRQLLKAAIDKKDKKLKNIITKQARKQPELYHTYSSEAKACLSSKESPLFALRKGWTHCVYIHPDDQAKLDVTFYNRFPVGLEAPNGSSHSVTAGGSTMVAPASPSCGQAASRSMEVLSQRLKEHPKSATVAH